MSNRRTVSFLVSLIAFLQCTCIAEEISIRILPKVVTLEGRNAEQHLLCEAFSVDKDAYVGSRLDEVSLRTSDPTVFVIEDNVALPVANGHASVIAEVDGRSIEARVTVVGMEHSSSRSFSYDVLPALSKAGCNMGACHGALAGKGGFKLSLRGYDPHSDYLHITREANGRRVELLDPGRSLILAKPTGAIPHKGGLRFHVDSPEYRAIAQWIAQGAKPPQLDDASIEHIRVLPERMLLKPGVEQRVIVQAYYGNGHVRDVTRWAKYESSNDAVAEVDQRGGIRVTGNGVGAVTAWFSSQLAIAHITVPFDNPVEEQALVGSHTSDHFIDRLVAEQLEKLNFEPSPLADDATFLRRVYIDMIGTLPSVEEVRRFTADQSLDKRNRVVDDLFSRKEFVDYWAYKWSDVLLVNGQLLRPQAVKAYYLWIREQVEKNTPWNDFAEKLLTAQGSALENGATNFYALHQDPESMTENACQAFLGLSIGCAKCHNHPLEKWTNDQYYAMANLFARVRAKGWGGDPRSGDGERTVYAAKSGDLLQPSTGMPQLPTPLDGEPLDIDWPGDRREVLAQWITSRDNPYFARAIANRIWANFFGVGLVEPVDDLRFTNPASNEKLLTAVADFLVENEFDLRLLMKEIVTSQAYQRSSQSLPANQYDDRFYSRYYPRRMPAEVLLDAISQVTNVPSEFTEISFPSSDKYETDFYPKGTRAIELYDSAVLSHFLKTFGRNSRTITCECQRTDTPSIVQVLHISNGDTINQKLSSERSRVQSLLESGLTDEQLIEQTFLFCLARQPTTEEHEQLAAIFEDATHEGADQEARRKVLEDLFWSIVSSREFLFNH